VRAETLQIVRCPYCGGRLEVVRSSYHVIQDDEIADAILACHCCVFPVVAGIPVLHLEPGVEGAREHVEAGRPDRAFLTLVGVADPAQAARLDALRSSATATYREAIGVLGPSFEGDYLLYRFSDPNYLVARAVVRAVARSVLVDGARALDLCGGSGHLTRLLAQASTSRPVLADRSFAQTWLARRFLAPGCDAVCCDANAPLPFARGSFGLAVCADAFQYVWTKRLAVCEMTRVVDRGPAPGAVVISHTHNQLEWSPSLGQPLPPMGYRDLFETLEPRVFGDARLLVEVIGGGPLDLGAVHDAASLDADPALTIVGSRSRDVFTRHPIEAVEPICGVLRINPLYDVETTAEGIRLSLRFPSEFYEQEYGGCRQYLPSALALTAGDVAALNAGQLNERLVSLVRRRILLDVPPDYL
jgi:SAM-dependent methyltransferase/uncharacterized protein YbaR (Trm112 family)